jgi:hypothetical protein
MDMVPRRSEIAKEQERVQAIANQLWHDNSLPKRPEGALWTHRYIQHSVGLLFFYISMIKSIIFKSDSLQHNTLGQWVDGMNDSSTICLMFQVHIIIFS